MPILQLTERTTQMTADDKNNIRNGQPEHKVRFPISEGEASRAYLRITTYSTPGMPNKLELVTSWTRVIGRFFRSGPSKWTFVRDPSHACAIISPFERRKCAEIIQRQMANDIILPELVWPSDVTDSPLVGFGADTLHQHD